MDKDSRTCLNILKNNRGATLIYIMAAFMIVSFIGVTMIKQSHHEMKSAADYSSMTTAEHAARSGLEATVIKFAGDGDATVTLLNNYITTPQIYPILGNESNKKEINEGLSYYTELISFDKTNFNVHVRSYGFGRGSSSKMIEGIYNLAGLQYETITTTDWSNENAIYMGEGVSFLMIGPVEISGNAFFGSSVDFDGACDGSIFKGIFKSDNDALASMDFTGNYTFDSTAYFGTKVHFDGTCIMNIKGRSGFENGADFDGDNNQILAKKDSYWNSSTEGIAWSAGDFVNLQAPDLTSNTLHHNGSYVFKTSYGATPLPVTTNYVEDNRSGNINILNELGIGEDECLINVDVTKLNSYIYDWETNFGQKQLPESPSHADDLDGALANAIWEKAQSDGKLWNDSFVVVNIDQDVVMSNESGENFTKKMILIVNSAGKLYTGGSATTFSGNATAKSNLTIVVQSGGEVQNIGGWNYYRGFFLCQSGGTMVIGGSPPAVDNVYGAMHAQSGSTVFWYPQFNTNSSITYDKTVLEELDHNEFLQTSGCGGASTTTTSTLLSLITPGAGVIATIQGLQS